MEPSDDWVVERNRVERLVIEASRVGTLQARRAAGTALDAFVSRFPEHRDKMIAFRVVIDRDPIGDKSTAG